MNAWTGHLTPTIILDLLLLAGGVLMVIFSVPLTRHHDARNDAKIADGEIDPMDAKPAPEYLKIGGIGVTTGIVFTILNLFK